MPLEPISAALRSPGRPEPGAVSDSVRPPWSGGHDCHSIASRQRIMMPSHWHSRRQMRATASTPTRSFHRRPVLRTWFRVVVASWSRTPPAKPSRVAQSGSSSPAWGKSSGCSLRPVGAGKASDAAYSPHSRLKLPTWGAPAFALTPAADSRRRWRCIGLPVTPKLRTTTISLEPRIGLRSRSRRADPGGRMPRMTKSSIYASNREPAPDSAFVDGDLAWLVVGNRGRLLDARRTPISVVEVAPERGSFVVRVDAFEDSGARWELSFDDVRRFQFDRRLRV
jgi:hypothetical protein